MNKEDKYKEYLCELHELLPSDEYKRIMSQDECEYEYDFLGFIDIYKPLSELIPHRMIVIDFGCYLSAQSYLFSNHKQYIGVDLVELKRFSPSNCKHYCMSIQDYIRDELPKLMETCDESEVFAICSYVPDKLATAIIRSTFSNVCCYYPPNKKRDGCILSKT